MMMIRATLKMWHHRISRIPHHAKLLIRKMKTIPTFTVKLGEDVVQFLKFCWALITIASTLLLLTSLLWLPRLLETMIQ